MARSLIGAPFSDAAELAQEGDAVLLYVGFSQAFFLPCIKSGSIFNMRLGNFHHADMIGQPYGSKVYDRKTGRWCALLRPTPRLLSESIRHRTQIIYQTDANTLLMLLDASPGKVIIESGTGSGSFTVNLARAVMPNGKVYTFESNASRYEAATKEFKSYKIFGETIVTHYRDVYSDGFALSGPGGENDTDDAVLEKRAPYADAAFLDLPQPWEALQHVQTSVKSGGRLCTFSPCVEQIQRTAEYLRSHGFRGIRIFESLAKPWATVFEPPPTISAQRRSERDEQNRKEGRQKRRRCSARVMSTGNEEATTSHETVGMVDTFAASGTIERAVEDGERDADWVGDTKSDIDLDAVDASGEESNCLGYTQHQFPMRGHTSYLLLAIVPPAPVSKRIS